MKTTQQEKAQLSKDRIWATLVMWAVFSILFVFIDFAKWHFRGHQPPLGAAAHTIVRDIINSAFCAWLFFLDASSWLIFLLSLVVTSVLSIVFLFELEKRITVSPSMDTIVTDATSLLQYIVIIAGIRWWLKRKTNQTPA